MNPDIQIEETPLPGIGRRFELCTEAGMRLTLVVPRAGGRELTIRPPDDDVAEAAVSLTDAEAVALAGLLTGAHVRIDRAEHP